MQPQANSTSEHICVADGYGIKVYVEHGHLIVHDGIGRNRRTLRFNRASSRLKRFVVIGHTGYITLDALRWIRDVGAAFVQIDRDGTLVSVSAPDRPHDSKLRRAQVLAADTDLGRSATVHFLKLKLDRQADLAEHRLSHLKATIRRNHRHTIAIADAIREQADAMNPALSFAELRKLESIAGRYYWQTWTHVPIRFDSSWRKRIPEHWLRAGPRVSRIDGQWPRRAMTPAHAMLNYAYAILETEAIIAAYAIGFDPGIGLMHADVRYRHSLATDLMEPARPVADEAVLDLLEQRPLSQGDVLETPRGICRIGPNRARELGAYSLNFRKALAPVVEDLARHLSGSRDHPTPLTGRRHRAAVQERRADLSK
jgi:CRISP-associated protein Cas1